MLGCGTYDVYVFPRGGGVTPTLVEFPWNTLTWGRVLDDTSQAIPAGAAGDCCELLQVVRPWQHEFAVYRNGQLVWQGPLIQPRPSVDLGGPRINLEFMCRDLSVWWERRLLHQDHSYAGADLATILNAYHTDAMAPDLSPNFSLVASPCGVLGTRATLAGEYRRASEEIRSISQIGIDWTVVARDALVGGVVVPTASIATLTDEHFMVPPQPNLDGTQQANRQVLLGTGTNPDGTNAVVGDASDTASGVTEGLLEDVSTDTSVLDGVSALAGARSKLALTTRFALIEEAILSPDAPVTIDELVPGALCRLELAQSCPPISGMYRLQRVSVTISDQQPEAVSVLFQPEGTS